MRTFFYLIVYSGLLLQFGCSGSDHAADANAVQVQNIETVSTPTIDAGPVVFTSAAEALTEGNRLFDDGDTEKAIDVLLQAVKLDPDLAEAHFKLGIAYSLVEARDDTVTEPVETPTPNSKDKKPKEVKPNSQKAFENAVKAYKKILASNKNDDNARFNLGLAYNKLNEDEDAAKSLKEAVKLKPDDTQYQTELGSILIKLAKYHEAVTALKKAIELDATNTKAEELLDKAEAGRKRIDFTTVKKDDKKPGNSNSSVKKEAEDPESNTSTKSANTKDAKTSKPPNTKEIKAPKPAKSPK
jgi:tetratricopeptide (TPR) repeat protein